MSDQEVCGYNVVSTLGKDMYKVKDKNDIYIAKRYTLDVYIGNGIPASALREVNILNRVDHPNIIRMKKIQLDENCNRLCAVYEYADMNLEKYIRSGLKDSDVLKLFFGVACGLKELHSNDIVCRDLKPKNCIIKDGIIKIADLNCIISTNTDVYSPQYCEELWWCAPEILMGDNNFTSKADIWSLGLILANMYMKQSIVETSDVSLVLEKIQTLIVKYKQKTHTSETMKYIYEHVYKKVPEEVLPLLFSMLETNPSKRADIDDVLNHPILSKFKCEISRDVFYSIDSTIASEFFHYGYDHGVRDRTKLIKLLNEFYKVFFKNHKNADVLFTAIDVFDRTFPYREAYHSKKMDTDMMSYAWAATCFWLASKIHTTYPIDINNIRTLTNNKLYNDEDVIDKVKENDFIRFECDILKKLKFQVYHTTLYSLFPKNKQKILNYLIENPSPVNVKSCDGVNQRNRKIIC